MPRILTPYRSKPLSAAKLTEAIENTNNALNNTAIILPFTISSFLIQTKFILTAKICTTTKPDTPPFFEKSTSKTLHLCIIRKTGNLLNCPSIATL
jgi:hypothetical protein